MKIYRCIVPVFFLVICFLSGEATAQKKRKQTIASQNEILFKQLKQEHNLDDSQMKKIRAIFKRSGYMSQGNPSITRHPVSEKACEQKLQKEEISYENSEFEKICGDKYMAPLFDPSSEKQEQANYCIDQFEFPNIPCAYPLIWVRAREAALICEAVGKRLCDAHEWESGCEGRLTPPDYRFDLAAKFDSKGAVKVMRKVHNAKYGKNKTWSYGKKYKKGICAANSKKSPGCSGGNWSRCGSNTYPAGYFSECRSSLEVYDIHGNAAEHMNLPLKESQMSCKGSKELGYTEMKGSWFIFDKYYAHQDWCRWRAPYWHGSRVMAKNSHRNYHLGFRCCKTLKEK
ncbi:MAG: hypothetical protein GY795_03475 [Desulfobacterales bacterium]|nr:hypothetical protein [Desulfobacterales bacterium]